MDQATLGTPLRLDGSLDLHLGDDRDYHRDCRVRQRFSRQPVQSADNERGDAWAVRALPGRGTRTEFFRNQDARAGREDRPGRGAHRRGRGRTLPAHLPAQAGFWRVLRLDGRAGTRLVPRGVSWRRPRRAIFVLRVRSLRRRGRRGRGPGAAHPHCHDHDDPGWRRVRGARVRRLRAGCPEPAGDRRRQRHQSDSGNSHRFARRHWRKDLPRHCSHRFPLLRSQPAGRSESTVVLIRTRWHDPGSQLAVEDLAAHEGADQRADCGMLDPAHPVHLHLLWPGCATHSDNVVCGARHLRRVPVGCARLAAPAHQGLAPGRTVHSRDGRLRGQRRGAPLRHLRNSAARGSGLERSIRE